MRLDDDRMPEPFDTTRRPERQPGEHDRSAPPVRMPDGDEARRQRVLTERERRERWPIG